MVQLTGNDKVALGHFSSLGYWLSGFTGSLIGDKSKSTEDIKFPKSLAFYVIVLLVSLYLWQLFTLL